VTDEEKVQAMLGRTVTWIDLDDGFLHIEVDQNMMFHIPYDTDYEIEVNGNIPN
jgi:hypothetical protein